MTQSDDNELSLHLLRRDDKLAAIASHLNVPISSFYDGIGTDAISKTEAVLQSEIGELTVLYSDLCVDQRRVLLAFARRLAVSAA